jgi:hypothetical protein
MENPIYAKLSNNNDDNIIDVKLKYNVNDIENNIDVKFDYTDITKNINKNITENIGSWIFMLSFTCILLMFYFIGLSIYGEYYSPVWSGFGSQTIEQITITEYESSGCHNAIGQINNDYNISCVINYGSCHGAEYNYEHFPINDTYSMYYEPNLDNACYTLHYSNEKAMIGFRLIVLAFILSVIGVDYLKKLNK